MAPMRSLPAVVLAAATLASGSAPPTRELPTVRSNPNIETAGASHDGVLTVALEAKQSLWRMNGENRPAMTIEAFSETGKLPVMPAPLIRAVKGTEIHLSIRNSLPKPLTFFIAAAIRGVPSGLAQDSVVVAPGAVGVVTTRAAVPGN